MRQWKRLLCIALAIAVVSVLTIRTIPRMTPKGDPLLSGAPQLVILSLISALALYLRQVNLNALELRYKIRHGEMWNLRPEIKYKKKRLSQLRMTSNAISLISPYMFVLMLIVCARIVCDAFSRFYYDSWEVPRLFYVADCLIVVWLSLGFVGLTYAHLSVRAVDDKIQMSIDVDDANEDPEQVTSVGQ